MTTTVGEMIKRARGRKGWNRMELSRATNIPHTTLRNIERAQSSVKTSEENLEKIAQALELNYDELRILAGYLTVPSNGDEHRKARLNAQIAAHPRLETALKSILERGDPEEIDEAAAVLEAHQEVILRRRRNRPRPPTKRQ
jgi:transcriptional regulator with XRE-family HTH domain